MKCRLHHVTQHDRIISNSAYVGRQSIQQRLTDSTTVPRQEVNWQITVFLHILKAQLF